MAGDETQRHSNIMFGRQLSVGKIQRHSDRTVAPPANPWMQTTTDTAFDLVNPHPEMVDFKTHIPEALSRIGRFNGTIRSGIYSVAQHSVIGADAIYRETGSNLKAAAFLLHDAHEAYIGDIITPAQNALCSIAAKTAFLDKSRSLPGVNDMERARAASDIVSEAISMLKIRIDVAIYQAAGMDYPLSPDIRKAVKEMDLRMCATERRFLLGPSPAPWHSSIEEAKPVRLQGRLTVWPWPDAADAFCLRLHRYIPDFAKRQRVA